MSFPQTLRKLAGSVFTFCGATLLASDAPPESPAPPTNQATVLIVVGAAGQPEFGSNFLHQANAWQDACTQSATRPITVGLSTAEDPTDFSRLKQFFEEEPKESVAPLWVVFIGHGTFDGKEARFNLRGPDVSGSDLAQWLQPFRRPLALINCASASAPFINKLSGPQRVIVTGTRSGHEQNFTRFGQYLAEAIVDPQADLDKDGQTSLLEAFLMASRQATEFYKVEGRLATEHALLDDNGDGLGTPADWFRGLRAVKKPKENSPVDGLLAGQFCLLPSGAESKLTATQRSERDGLERAVLLHREKKSRMSEEQYYRELEPLLMALAQFYKTNGSLERTNSKVVPTENSQPPKGNRDR